MDLEQIVKELKVEARQPALVIAAFEKTLDALIFLAVRIDALEAAARVANMSPSEVNDALRAEMTSVVKRPRGRPRKAA